MKNKARVPVRRDPFILMTFEILNFAFVLFRRLQAIEGAKIVPFVCSCIFLAGVYAVLT
jgi:hypothetical protein